MFRRVLITTLFSTMSFVPIVALAGVQISEVQFNPVGTDTGAEYVIIKNTGGLSENLYGWQLYPDSDSVQGYYFFGNISISGGSTLTIRLRTSGTDTNSDVFH